MQGAEVLVEAFKPFVELQRNPNLPTVTDVMVEAFKLNDNGGPVQPDGAAVQITPTLLLSSAMAKGFSSKTYIVDLDRFDVWQPIPFGRNARGKLIGLSLMWESMFFGGLPRQGKTFAKWAAHKIWHATAAFLAGFFVAGTGAAPYITNALTALARTIHH